MIRTIELQLDEADWNTIQNEFARKQRSQRDGFPLPDGESNLPGAIIAELVREVIDLREAWSNEFDANRKAGRK